MIKWRFPADGSAIHSAAGELRDGALVVRNSAGCAAFGPYLDVPAGSLNARFILQPGASGTVTIDVTSESSTRYWGTRTIDLAVEPLAIDVHLPESVANLEIRAFCEADAKFAITELQIDLDQADASWPPSRSRVVGTESSKSFVHKLDSGFLDRYLSGPSVLEVGYRGYYEEVLPIVPRAVGVDVGYPGYDGVKLPFADESFSAVYSSHCLEHIPDPIPVLQDWFRVLPIGGFLIIAVPHQWLYERRTNLPSGFNPDHYRFYTPQALLAEIAAALPVNSYRIRHLIENDRDFDYSVKPGLPPSGSFEIELVLEKIKKPFWNLDDHTVRAYAAAEFSTSGTLLNPWSLELELAMPGCAAWGPYTWLPAGSYEAVFYFSEKTGAEPAPLSFDVAKDMNRIAAADSSSGVRRGDGQLSSVAVPFEANADRGVMEFRVYVDSPSQGSITFAGVDLRYR